MFMLKWEGINCREYFLVGDLASLKALWDLLENMKIHDTSSLTNLATMRQMNTKRTWPEDPEKE